jgi:hypothetical protein
MATKILSPEDLSQFNELIRLRDEKSQVLENTQLRARIAELELQVAYLNLRIKYAFSENDKLDIQTGVIASAPETSVPAQKE